jgi:endonuclease/exonuclease/phosphatase family metal-dependent hydrolase
MIRIATYNVENLFARPRAFDPTDWSAGRPALQAYSEVNDLFTNSTYTTAQKNRMRQLLLTLDIYYRNSHGAIRRKLTRRPRWAWLRKNRGKFDRQPRDTSLDVEIVADGRASWIGWVELAREPTNETGTRLTARVISDLDADIVGIVEAEDRPSLVRFNHELLGDLHDHVMLVDGNDDRGIDVAIMTRAGFDIESIHSNVDTTDAVGIVFSRDCAEYSVRTPGGTLIHVLMNHFKSQSGGGGEKRLRQAAKVREIIDDLHHRGEDYVVMGDFNEGPPSDNSPAPNLLPLFEAASPLVDCYTLPDFDVGARPGTWDSCGLRNRFDYILLSPGLADSFTAGSVLRTGLWGSRTTRPTNWDTYPEMTSSPMQASDHAAVYVDLDID